MKKVKQTQSNYMVIHASNGELLEKRVESLLKDGFICVGGVSILRESEDSDNVTYVQALIKPIIISA